MRRLISRATPQVEKVTAKDGQRRKQEGEQEKERKKERQSERGWGGEETQLAGGVPCPGIATVGHVFSFSNMCSALGWVCVADAAGRRFLLPSSSSSSFAARITQMLRAPFHKKTLYAERPTSEAFPRSLAANFIEPLARTPARHNFNWCRHEKQLLHKLTRHQLAVHSCYLLRPFPPCSISSSTTLCCFLPTEAAQLPFRCQFACIFYLLVLNACTLCMSACVCQCVSVPGCVCGCADVHILGLGVTVLPEQVYSKYFCDFFRQTF